jgi:hypothetical protein
LLDALVAGEDRAHHVFSERERHVFAHSLGHDPAFGSGPLATVVQDLLSIAIYFAVAVPIVL